MKTCASCGKKGIRCATIAWQDWQKGCIQDFDVTELCLTCFTRLWADIYNMVNDRVTEAKEGQQCQTNPAAAEK